MIFSILFGPVDTLISTDTFHVDDYSGIVADVLEALVDRKLKHRREVFPHDCEKALELGARFATESHRKHFIGIAREPFRWGQGFPKKVNR